MILKVLRNLWNTALYFIANNKTKNIKILYTRITLSRVRCKIVINDQFSYINRGEEKRERKKIPLFRDTRAHVHVCVSYDNKNGRFIWPLAETPFPASEATHRDVRVRDT